MATLRYQPIAVQISKMVPVGALLPSDVLDQVRRDQPAREPDDPELDPEVDGFLLYYVALARAGMKLLGAPPFARLARLYDAIEEEYMPGGPPMSPVYDSMAAQLVLGDVTHGVAHETPYSVLAQLTRGDATRARLHQLAQSMSDAHRDLYRVVHADGLSADLETLSGGAPLKVRLTGPFLRTGDFVLARVVRFGAPTSSRTHPISSRLPSRTGSTISAGSGAAEPRMRTPKCQ